MTGPYARRCRSTIAVTASSNSDSGRSGSADPGRAAQHVGALVPGRVGWPPQQPGLSPEQEPHLIGALGQLGRTRGHQDAGVVQQVVPGLPVRRLVLDRGRAGRVLRPAPPWSGRRGTRPDPRGRSAATSRTAPPAGEHGAPQGAGLDQIGGSRTGSTRSAYAVAGQPGGDGGERGPGHLGLDRGDPVDQVEHGVGRVAGPSRPAAPGTGGAGWTTAGRHSLHRRMAGTLCTHDTTCARHVRPDRQEGSGDRG